MASRWNSCNMEVKTYCLLFHSLLEGNSNTAGLGWWYLSVYFQRQGLQIWMWSLPWHHSFGGSWQVLARLLLNRLMEHICPKIIPETQCGFRSGRGTTDMIFVARQIQEKCIQQQIPLYQDFVDLTKAFDTVNWEALWKLLGKLGCSPTFTHMLKQLHRDMKAYVTVSGTLSD